MLPGFYTSLDGIKPRKFTNSLQSCLHLSTNFFEKV
nr:MAG TPA: hypothetical protein [Caudoviricetes sp.]